MELASSMADLPEWREDGHSDGQMMNTRSNEYNCQDNDRSRDFADYGEGWSTDEEDNDNYDMVDYKAFSDNSPSFRLQPCNVQDYEDEEDQCGICREALHYDSGMLDCCPHKFCFVCLEEWAHAMSTCPLCYRQFRFFTRIPRASASPFHSGPATGNDEQYDPNSDPRHKEVYCEDRDGLENVPSYFIDEDSVECLEGDQCRIKRGEWTPPGGEEGADVSVACDRCDRWYHAGCIGFDSAAVVHEFWHCPQCLESPVEFIPISTGGNGASSLHLEGCAYPATDVLAVANCSSLSEADASLVGSPSGSKIQATSKEGLPDTIVQCEFTERSEEVTVAFAAGDLSLPCLPYEGTRSLSLGAGESKATVLASDQGKLSQEAFGMDLSQTDEDALVRAEEEALANHEMAENVKVDTTGSKYDADRETNLRSAIFGEDEHKWMHGEISHGRLENKGRGRKRARRTSLDEDENDSEYDPEEDLSCENQTLGRVPGSTEDDEAKASVLWVAEKERSQQRVVCPVVEDAYVNGGDGFERPLKMSKAKAATVTGLASPQSEARSEFLPPTKPAIAKESTGEEATPTISQAISEKGESSALREPVSLETTTQVATPLGPRQGGVRFGQILRRAKNRSAEDQGGSNLRPVYVDAVGDVKGTRAFQPSGTFMAAYRQAAQKLKEKRAKEELAIAGKWPNSCDAPTGGSLRSADKFQAGAAGRYSLVKKLYAGGVSRGKKGGKGVSKAWNRDWDIAFWRRKAIRQKLMLNPSTSEDPAPAATTTADRPPGTGPIVGEAMKPVQKLHLADSSLHATKMNVALRAPRKSRPVVTLCKLDSVTTPLPLDGGKSKIDDNPATIKEDPQAESDRRLATTSKIQQLPPKVASPMKVFPRAPMTDRQAPADAREAEEPSSREGPAGNGTSENSPSEDAGEKLSHQAQLPVQTSPTLPVQTGADPSGAGSSCQTEGGSKLSSSAAEAPIMLHRSQSQSLLSVLPRAVEASRKVEASALNGKTASGDASLINAVSATRKMPHVTISLQEKQASCTPAPSGPAVHKAKAPSVGGPMNEPAVPACAEAKGSTELDAEGRAARLTRAARLLAKKAGKSFSTAAATPGSIGQTPGKGGDFALLLKLPLHMRPLLEFNHRSRVPTAVRQVYLSKWTEHHLQAAFLPVIGDTPDCRAAISTACAAEKELFERAGNKAVYISISTRALAQAKSATEAKPLAAQQCPPVSQTADHNCCPKVDTIEPLNTVRHEGPVCIQAAADGVARQVQRALLETGLVEGSPPGSPPRAEIASAKEMKPMIEGVSGFAVPEPEGVNNDPAAEIQVASLFPNAIKGSPDEAGQIGASNCEPGDLPSMEEQRAPCVPATVVLGALDQLSPGEAGVGLPVDGTFEATSCEDCEGAGTTEQSESSCRAESNPGAGYKSASGRPSHSSPEACSPGSQDEARAGPRECGSVDFVARPAAKSVAPLEKSSRGVAACAWESDKRSQGDFGNAQGALVDSPRIRNSLPGEKLRDGGVMSLGGKSALAVIATAPGETEKRHGRRTVAARQAGNPSHTEMSADLDLRVEKLRASLMATHGPGGRQGARVVSEVQIRDEGCANDGCSKPSEADSLQALDSAPPPGKHISCEWSGPEHCDSAGPLQATHPGGAVGRGASLSGKDRLQLSEADPMRLAVHDKRVQGKSLPVPNVEQQVEAFVIAHLKPLYKSGVITSKQLSWAARKTTAKVMGHHQTASSADFLIREGTNVRHLAERYVEAFNNRRGQGS